METAEFWLCQKHVRSVLTHLSLGSKHETTGCYVAPKIKCCTDERDAEVVWTCGEEKKVVMY
jgi:hypothetical protein